MSNMKLMPNPDFEKAPIFCYNPATHQLSMPHPDVPGIRMNITAKGLREAGWIFDDEFARLNLPRDGGGLQLAGSMAQAKQIAAEQARLNGGRRH